MKCKNYFFSLFVALLGVFFGSCIINQNDTYAVEDVTYTINSSNYSLYFCGSSSGVDCSQYSYLYIQRVDSAALGYFQFRYPYGGSILYPVFSFNQPFILLSFDSFPSNFYIQGVAFTGNYSGNVIVTLSENNPFAGSTPSGSIELTENGTYDVSQYAEAVVNVPETDCPPSSGGGGNYHEDLVAINNSILICAAVCLVIYFFYCIYRMIIKNSGVK